MGWMNCRTSAVAPAGSVTSAAPVRSNEVTAARAGAAAAPLNLRTRREVHYQHWAAIDFETATEHRSTPCAVGIVLFDDGRPVLEKRFLIQPPGNDYSPINSFIHGIGPSDTAGAPDFADLWVTIASLVDGRVLVGHSASFDMTVLSAAWAEAGIAPDPYHFACTLVLARRAWPGRYTYCLPAVADIVGYDFNHHDPLDDAAAAGHIAAALTRDFRFDLSVACEAFGVKLGSVSTETYRSCGARPVNISKLSPTGPVERSSELFGRTVLFTGALGSMTRSEAAQLVVNAGGTCATSMSKKVHYLVAGEQDVRKFTPGRTQSSKMRRFEELVAHGHQAELITERDLLRMLA